MTRKKKGLLALAAVVVAAAAVYFLFLRRGSSGEEAAEEATAPVERGDVRSTVSSSGRVVANLDVEIKCKASGEVVSLPFDVSDAVKKGELLLKLDPVDEERSVRRAETSLGASEARQAQARQNLRIAEQDLATTKRRAGAALRSAEAREADARTKAERMGQLLEKKLCSQEECDTARTAAVGAAADLEAASIRIEELKTEALAIDLKRQDVRLAGTQVALDRLTLETARQRLADTSVVAPVDGIVSDRRVQTGQIISSGISNVGGGTAVLTLSDLSRIFVLASVDESDIGKIRVGQEAEITADSFRETRFRGEVRRIAARGASVSNVVTFEVKIEVLGETKSLLRPEMTADVQIITDQREKVLLVPAEAVQRNGEERTVVVAKGEDSAEERTVELGVTDGVMVEIKKGLTEGETILLRPGEGSSRWRKDPRRGGASARRMMLRLGGGRGHR